MPRFLAVYTGQPNLTGAPPPEMSPQQLEAGMAAWGAWMETNAAHVVDPGGPLGVTKKVSKAGVEDTHNQLGGFTLIEAESHEAAARLFENHPHFTHFPGEAVEIMPCLPIPGAP